MTPAKQQMKENQQHSLKALIFTVFINQRFSIHKTLSSHRDKIEREVFGPLFEVFDSTNKQDSQSRAYVPFPNFVFETEDFPSLKVK